MLLTYYVILTLSVTTFVTSQDDVDDMSVPSYINIGAGSSGWGADCFTKFPWLRDRFSTAQLEFFCQQIRATSEALFNNTEMSLDDLFTYKQIEWLKSLQINITLAADNANVAGPWSATRFVRKEIRQHTSEELNSFNVALRRLKLDMIDGINKYDLLVALHHPALSPGAHVGAAYLPWHREYLRTFEKALSEKSPKFIGLPYWDSTLDQPLPMPSHSIVWNNWFFGIKNGPLRFPFMSDNATFFVKGLTTDAVPTIRNVNNTRQGKSLLFTKELEDTLMQKTSYKELTACVDITLEQADHQVAEFVGGSMDNLYYSPQDWLFLLHHANIDRLWTHFRELHADSNSALIYNPDHDACTQYHRAKAPMRPFPMTNVEAFNANNAYESIYSYAELPQCITVNESAATIECGNNPYLFCYKDLNRCISRVQRNGSCQGLESYNPCVGLDVCLGGVCQYVGITSDDTSQNNDDDVKMKNANESEDQFLSSDKKIDNVQQMFKN